MDNNRIGSACWYKPKGERGAKGPWTGGYLRLWSTAHDEYENGPGHYPVGVVEDSKTGCCHSIFVEDICFGIPPGRGSF